MPEANSTQIIPDAELRHQSPWTLRQRLGRALWSVTHATLFRWSPRPLYGFRAALLRLFGARIGAHVKIHPTVSIAVPWHLDIGDHSAIGDCAILYSLGKITLGQYVTISQYAHLCAGTHETKTRAMTLLRPPITIGDDVWVATDAFVGPGVTIGARTLLGARSSAFSDLPPDVVAVGSPARPIKPREFNAT